jgi:uncharacterized protein (TIGR02284 family)
MDNSQVVDVLNDVIETCKDGEYGFKTCAENATAPALKQTFLRRASECAGATTELASLVVQYGGKPEDGGSLSGALHRGWVKVVDAVSGTSDQALLNESERGEDTALARYRKALKEEGLPSDVLAVLSRQMLGVQRNHDEIKLLRDQYKASA